MTYGNSFDLMKLVLSFFVVAIHINPFGSELWYIRYPITRVAVPLFFMMSSYFFFKKIKLQDTKQQLKSLFIFVKRNLILYMSWFIVLFPVTYDYYKYYKLTGQEMLDNIVMRFFYSSTFKSSWYLMGLVIGVVIIYFLTKITNNKVGIIVGFICYAICAMLSNYAVIFKDVQIIHTIKEAYPFAMYYGFPVGLLFINMGKVLAEKENLKADKHTYLKLAISTVLLFVEAYLVITNEWYGETPCFIMLIPFCWYCFIVVSNMKIKIPYGKEIRVISTVMYCFHFSFKLIIDDYLIGMGWELSTLPYSMYLYLMVVMTSVVVALIIYRLSQNKYFSILKNFY